MGNVLHWSLLASTCLLSTYNVLAAPTQSNNSTDQKGAGHKAVPITNATKFEDPAKDSTHYGFPGASALGYAIRIDKISPFVAESILQARLTGSRIFRFSDSPWSFDPGTGKPWSLPDNIECYQDFNTLDGKFESYATGSAVAEALSGSADLQARYEVVSGEGSVKAGISKSFHDSLEYGLFDYTRKAAYCEIPEWSASVDSQFLLRVINNYLERWDATKPDVVKKYRAFFREVGTHVIRHTDFGGRFLLETWASNQGAEYKEDFGMDVKATYNEIVAGGTADVSVKQSSQYKAFQASYTWNVDCKGGDQDICSTLHQNPGADGIENKYEQWESSIKQSPDVISIDLVPMSAVVGQQSNEALSSWRNDISQAYEYTVQNPEVFKTKIRMTVFSDWGQLFILSTSSFIEIDPEWDNKDNFQISNSKVTYFGNLGQRGASFQFYVTNGGESVDMRIFHGRDEKTPSDKTGYVELTADSSSRYHKTSGADSEVWTLNAKDVPANNSPALQSALPPITTNTKGTIYGQVPSFGNSSSSAGRPPGANTQQPGGQATFTDITSNSVATYKEKRRRSSNEVM